MLTAEYWKRLAEDAWTGFLAGFGSAFVGDVVNAWNVDWKLALGLGVGTAVLMVVKGGALARVGAEDSPRIR